MKRIFISLLTFLAVSLSLNAFDWQPQCNENLYDDMMEYARGCQKDMQRIPAAGKIFDKFVASQPLLWSEDQYAWIKNVYKLVYDLEKIVPPHIEDGSDEALIRRHMFRMLDFPIHVDQKGEYSTAEERDAWTYGRDANWEQGCERVVAALKKPAPEPGVLEILKVYNMGYVLRTSNHCIGIDLCWHGSRTLANKLAGHIEAMFVTHPHGDHYTTVMLEAVLEAEKKLVLSKDIGPKDNGGLKTVTWENIMDTPLDICGIKVRTLAGHQNKENPAAMPNNVYYLEFDGWTIVHHGDNSDRELQKRLSELNAPDLAFVATWNKPQKVMDVFRNCPDAGTHRTLFISSHENEYGHRVQQRESYWETYTRKDRYGNPEYNYYPWMTMEAGERYLLKK